MPAHPAPSGAEVDPPLLILGGHRSGTSLVSGLLWQAGLHMGELLAAGPDNPRGFFESVEVLEAHTALLRAQERDWTCPPHRLDPNAVDLAALRRVIAGLAGAGRPWGVKDPRLLFLLPAWVEILPAMRLVGVLRHPAAAAASLARRNGFSPEVAGAIAQAHLARLAALHHRLRFPVFDYDGPRAALLERAEALAASLGLAWDQTAADDLFDPELRHQGPQGPGGDDYQALAAAAAHPEDGRVYRSWEVAEALAAIPDRPTEAVPLVAGPAFAARRDCLWQFESVDGPHLGRVLDVAPPEGHRPPLLEGVDRVEADFATFHPEQGMSPLPGEERYSHVLLTGVAETIPTAGLTALLGRLSAATGPDAVAAFDALVVEGNTIPPMKRWASLSITSSRGGPLYHHHLAEVETAALDGGWLVGKAAVGPGRSRVLLVKLPGRRAPGWLTPTERREALVDQGRRLDELQERSARLEAALAATRDEARATLERERLRHRLAYEALLTENADIRHLYHERLGELKAELKKLRRLRTIRGWTAFQLRRLSPARLGRGIKRRLGRSG